MGDEATRWRWHDRLEEVAGADLGIDIGYEAIRLQKVYGPRIFADLIIKPDAATGEWVITRQMGGEYDAAGNFVRDTWKEWVRIPGQLPEDFRDD